MQMKWCSPTTLVCATGLQPVAGIAERIANEMMCGFTGLLLICGLACLVGQDRQDAEARVGPAAVGRAAPFQAALRQPHFYNVLRMRR